MTGSVIDGEDVVQEALIKAIEASPDMGSIAHPEGWLFRIAHNVALDFLRRRARQDAAHSNVDPDMLVDPESTADGRAPFVYARCRPRSAAASSSWTCSATRCTRSARSSTAAFPSVKAALHRGRARLRELAHEPDDRPLPILTEPQRALLAAYVDRFNARDFEPIRNMLADEVRLELVNKTRMNGKGEVGKYFGNYSLVQDWQLVPGFVDRRPAILVRDPGDASGAPTYFVLLDWAGDRLIGIRDFRHARYAIDGAELLALG
jgi:RNA polymerase sigma-70 factor (ECF subfamily)